MENLEQEKENFLKQLEELIIDKDYLPKMKMQLELMILSAEMEQMQKDYDKSLEIMNKTFNNSL